MNYKVTVYAVDAAPVAVVMDTVKLVAAIVIAAAGIKVVGAGVVMLRKAFLRGAAEPTPEHLLLREGASPLDLAVVPEEVAGSELPAGPRLYVQTVPAVEC